MREIPKKRGQGTIEFIVLFIATLFFFVVFMGIIQINTLDKNIEKQKIFLQNIAMNIRDEISFAAESTNGYSREFYVPENSLGIEYTINLTENHVFLFMSGHSVSYQIFNVTGEVQKGNNLIRKENGEIYVN